VVVCTKERPELLKRSLASIEVAAAAVPGTEVIVVEQGVPSAKAVCEELGLDATIVTSREVGASKARNEAIARARGDIVLFTDDDCEVPPDWVAAHTEALSDPQSIASFGPVGGLRYDEEYDPVALPARHRRGSPPWIVGHSSNMAARRSALAQVGGFDERIGPGTKDLPAGEDADVIVRLLRIGDVVTGTGDAVRHIDWRSAEDRTQNLMAYEHGAGAWIGKALREQPHEALSFLTARIELQKGTAAHAKDIGDRTMTRAKLARAFARGLLEGIKLKPWRKPIAERPDR
jgi:glycosyltransferase involved in cell wall biosynthesis